MPTVPFKVKAVFEYKSEEPDDLNFENGQIITVTEEEDEQWYTGEYMNASGEKLAGIFPKNFVEKYEPAIPTRPARAPKRAPTQDASEPPPEAPAPQAVPSSTESSQHLQEEQKPPAEDSEDTGPVKSEPVEQLQAAEPVAMPSSTVTPRSPPPSASTKPPPPVADKPSSSSFKDRIAAFNKPAAAPVAPFKPAGSTSTGFIKKPFVAPPPSRNAYVPPTREQPVQKPPRREEEPSTHEAENRDATETVAAQDEVEAQDQPKPQSLKDRIALLQKQQLEQAARNAEKKDKPKKPPKKPVDTSETGEQPPPPEAPSVQTEKAELSGQPSVEVAEEAEHIPAPSRRVTGIASVTPQPQPSRELVSDTNDADDSGAGDDEDAQETSTEEERPKSKGLDQPSTHIIQQQPAANDGAKSEDEDEDADEEEEEEDPEVRRRRELRERMAKMSGGMGMMGMFGPPGGVGLPGATRKPKSSESRQQTHITESQSPDEPEERPAPIRIMALPGMSNPAPKPQEEPNTGEDGGADVTARPTPQEPPIHGESEDYVSQPPPRRSTDRAPPPIPQGEFLKASMQILY